MKTIQDILIEIENLKNLGKYQDAFFILEKIHNIQDYSLSDQIEYNIVLSEILYYLGKFRQSFELAKPLFQLCQESGTPLQLLDASLRCGECLFRLGEFNESEKSLNKSEKIMNELKAIPDDIIGLREAIITHTKSCLFWYNGANELALEESIKCVK